ncbi:MAG: L,D-transpeptidase family protein [Chthoniobacterales bacterium]|nr:L,D-transpeptidase family protein [Chthoniobacterales bacterium]
MTRTSLRLLAALIILVAPFNFAVAQVPRPIQRVPAPTTRQLTRPASPPQQMPRQAAAPNAQPAPMRKAAELINRQPPIIVDRTLYDSLASDDARVVVSLSKQRAYLLNGDQVAIDSPISSGKRAGMTPTGSFSVMEKDKDHRSSVYGNFVDRSGRVVRGGISVRIDSAPSGTHYEGAPMLWFMRLTGEGVGMHVGILPGYPASHGCIRMPTQGAEMFYNKVKIGTPVRVES